ncbi:hypothetical protein SAMN05518854_103115 [Variovorax sp. YR266]|uniref:hypothetical protein n=1 Tax=Variovorax sp. YR266 TaxID=1884386 RepID=UPI00089A193E|nr:hypothetical protein [Variovorax sp. YR266]SDY97283.1 hypothetical protein SAMN05518854_103115 [Variovorax sp. YR266]
MGHKVVDNLTLERWRRLDSVALLRALAIHMAQDAQFKPRANPKTTRWHANVADRDYEFLCTGPKFHDSRAQCGGGGAVDLVMHLFELDFKGAVAFLKGKGL